MSLVKRTQSALTLLGFDIANANGQLDESTVTAIRSYQQSFGLFATGNPSQELLDHMKRQLQAMCLRAATLEVYEAFAA